ncbi:MAG TPA: putative lipoprotein [Candidatus Methylomirabilis sp.]|nr:putative lipoprotein [Candidatus Methylomirabilis sp.]
MPQAPRVSTAHWLSRAALLLLAALAPIGCASSDSFSDSSGSSSDSANNSSKSSSNSSSPEGSKSSYLDDVRVYTAAVTKSGAPVDDAFQKQLGALAQRHGISNWEDEMATFRAVGEGVGQGGGRPARLDTYMELLARSDPEKREAMKEGYETATR